MGRSIFSHPDGIVGEDMDGGYLHDRAQTNGRPGVVAEDQEPGAEGTHLGERHSVYRCSHRMLPHPEMHVTARWALPLQVSGAVEGQPSLGGRSQIAGATDEPGDIPGEGVQDLTGCLPPGHPLGIGWKGRQIPVPSVWQLAALHAMEVVSEIGMLFAVVLVARLPGLAQLASPPADAVAQTLAHAVRDQELGVLRPAIDPLGEANLLLP